MIKSIFFFLIIALFLSFDLEAAKINWPDKVEWHSSLSQVKAKSLRENKPVLAVLYADWCPACHRLSKSFNDQDIAILSKNFLMLRLNLERNRKAAADFFGPIRNIPRVYAFDAYSKPKKHDQFLIAPGVKKLKSFMISSKKKFGKVSFDKKVLLNQGDYRKLCAKGKSDACAKYAEMMLNKNKVRKALAFYNKSCSMKYLDSCYEAALIYFSMENAKEANQLLRDTCSKKHIKSCQLLNQIKVAE